MPTKKEIAESFLKLAATGKSREAFMLYAGVGFRHHNMWFKGDVETLMTAMEKSTKENPDKIFEIQRSLNDGDLAAVHSRIRQKPEELGFAVIHIFRFEADKIVELWDFGQEVLADMPNENGMF